MENNDITEILSNALKISVDKTYNVRIYENNVLYTESKLTYLELGMMLVNKSNTIKRVDIKLNSE